jgi:hypothetical protein
MAIKNFQMVIKYTNIYHSNALQNLPKFGIFGLKTNHLATLLVGIFLIWQPCPALERISPTPAIPKPSKFRLFRPQILDEKMVSKNVSVSFPGADVITIFDDFRLFSAKKIGVFSKTNVMITIFGDFRQFSAKKLVFFSKNDVMITIFCIL